MNRIRRRLLGGVENAADVEIRFRWTCRAETNAFVRFADVQSMRIRIRIDGNGADPEAFRGPHDATGNFSAVCDEELLDLHIRKTPG